MSFGSGEEAGVVASRERSLRQPAEEHSQEGGELRALTCVVSMDSMSHDAPSATILIDPRKTRVSQRAERQKVPRSLKIRGSHDVVAREAGRRDGRERGTQQRPQSS